MREARVFIGPPEIENCKENAKLRNTFETLVKLYTISGRKDKAKLISENKQDLKLQEFFKIAMDNYICFGVSETSFKDILSDNEYFYKPNEMSALFANTNSEYKMDHFETFIKDVIPCLIENQVPSTDVLTKLKEFFRKLNPIERYFYYRAIIKNLNIGIGPKTINEALGALLIKQYTPMLADSGIEKFDKWEFEKEPEYMVDTKINGLRLTIFSNVENRTCQIFTRSGRRFEYLEEYLNKNWLSKDEVIAKLKDSMTHQNELIDRYNTKANKFKDVLVLDMELQHRDKTWESSISVINLNEIDIYPDPFDQIPMFYLHCFDVVDGTPFFPENFNVQCETLQVRHRREALEKLITSLPSCLASNVFKLSDCQLVEGDLSRVEELAKKYIANGFEGAVVKHPNSMYICERKYCWLKIKDIQTYDGVIESILPGDKSGKYANVASKIIVRTTINGQEIKGSIGTGFKDDVRKHLMENQNQLIGTWVEFTVLGKTVKDNFQSGVFKQFRPDKT